MDPKEELKRNASLRTRVIRLAAAKPELRPYLLPLVRSASHPNLRGVLDYMFNGYEHEPSQASGVSHLVKYGLPQDFAKALIREWDAMPVTVGGGGLMGAQMRAENLVGSLAVKHGVRLASEKKAGSPLQVGRTILSDGGNIRIHRYTGSVVVTDLTNAGKRGKRCMEARLWDIDMIRNAEVERDLEGLLSHLADSPTYQAAANRIRGFVTAVEMFHSDIGIRPQFDERELRGVDVTPGGFAPIVIRTKNFDLESDFNDFTVRSNTDKYNLPTCIPASKGGKESIKAFYRWVSDNRAAIERMTYEEVMDGLYKEGIKSHQYCAMD